MPAGNLERKSDKRIPALPVFLVSASTFLFQIALTRLFAIAHFYHFAFIIIALALLGGGASGSFLSVYPRLNRVKPRRLSYFLCAACSLSILVGFILINRMPFDAYAVAIDRVQFLILFTHFVALAAPFFFVGLLVSVLMKQFPHKSHVVYACNLSGSALGCLLAPVVLSMAGCEGTVMASTGIAALASLLTAFPLKSVNPFGQSQSATPALPLILICLALVIMPSAEVFQRVQSGTGNPIFDAHMSPYKPLSYALQYPGAEIVSTRWNAFSRVDVVRSGGIRSLPGLSYLYPEVVAAQAGVFVDGSDLNALLPADPGASYFSYLPQSLAFQLRPSANVLILESRTGIDILTASTLGAGSIRAVEPNPLLMQAADSVYRLPGVKAIQESPRAFLAGSQDTFDIILLPLTSSYFPVTSGAYSLGEDYRYTRESFQSAFTRLNPGGFLVVSRWLQIPPSEFLRAFILAVESLEDLGLDPSAHIAALRGYNLGLLIVKASPIDQTELDAIRQFSQTSAFDLVYLAGLSADESNRFNVLLEDEYFNSFNTYLASQDRSAWLRAYPYQVAAPTDDHPFFMHFFKWSQFEDILAIYGSTWQPFGGAGYLVMVFLLLLMMTLSGLLIIVPLVLRRSELHASMDMHKSSNDRCAVLAFFMLIGAGFMAVEIPLIHKFILYLGQPTYAISAVISALLLTSGLGSLASTRIPRAAIVALAVLVMASPLWLSLVFNATLHWHFRLRILVAFACLAPLGFLMGAPLAKGIAVLNKKNPTLIPWAWAVNGTSSVITSVLAALLALSFNFSSVLLLGCAAYLLAFYFLVKMSRG